MKYSILLTLLLGVASLNAVEVVEVNDTPDTATTELEVVEPTPVEPVANTELGAVTPVDDNLLAPDKIIRISVTGQGVAPMNSTSPAQAYALAKRAAIADGYRLIAERVKGVRVDGQDVIKNMMVKRSSVRTSVNAVVRDANIIETTFKDGLCEVEMEIVLSHSMFAR